MSEFLNTIKEVQEGGKKMANWYLEHGYVLLHVSGGSRLGRFPAGSPRAAEFFVRRNPVFVVGRPEGVEVAPDPPEWTPRPTPEAGG